MPITLQLKGVAAAGVNYVSKRGHWYTKLVIPPAADINVSSGYTQSMTSLKQMHESNGPCIISAYPANFIKARLNTVGKAADSEARLTSTW